MLQNMFVTVPMLTLLAGLFSNSAMLAQITPEQLDAMSQTLAQADTFFQKSSPQQRRTLSGAAQNLMRLSEEWPNIEPQLLQMSQRPATQAPTTALPPLAVGSAGSAVPASNPSTDFINSIKEGFTQSETSTAWCGDNVVVGYNDSGSFLESLQGRGGISFAGVSLSTDGGASFQDLGYLNPGPSGGTLEGDPVVRCTDPRTFYYSSIFSTFTGPFSSNTTVSVSKSTNGGLSFGNPVPAVSKDFHHFLDKPWMATDPTNPNRIYVSYTDFDSSGACPGSFNERIAIEIVRSTDGGSTWSAPVVIAEVCNASPNSPFVQGSQIAVGPGGEVYTAYEAYANSPIDFTSVRETRVRKSADHGQSFAPFVKVADVTFVGDGNFMQGGFRNFLDLGSIAVDQSGTASKGNVYIDWQDGRFGKSPDFFGSYNYADVLMSRSTDGGATWSAPVRVNDNSKPPGARGTDQYQPSLAVDNTGTLGLAGMIDARIS
jgi:hypothetical protein